MLTLRCPCCGVDADETELKACGEAHLKRAGPVADARQFTEYMFMRDNPMGISVERWHHTFGCGKYFHVVRSSITMQVFGTYPAQTLEPPPRIVEAVRVAHPDWSWKDLSAASAGVRADESKGGS